MASGVLARVATARGEFLRRSGNDLLWSEIGRALDWSQPTTSAIKNAKRPIDLEELPGLAVVLHVRLCWLAFEEGPMKGVGDAAPAGRAPGVDSASYGEDAEEATLREIADRAAPGAPGDRRPRAAGEGRSRPATTAHGRSGAADARQKPRLDR